MFGLKSKAFMLVPENPTVYRRARPGLSLGSPVSFAFTYAKSPRAVLAFAASAERKTLR
jgi:hypothetical protein